MIHRILDLNGNFKTIIPLVFFLLLFFKKNKNKTSTKN